MKKQTSNQKSAEIQSHHLFIYYQAKERIPTGRKLPALHSPAPPLNMRTTALLLLLSQAAWGFAPARRASHLTTPPTRLSASYYEEDEDWYDAMVRRKRQQGGGPGGEEEEKKISGPVLPTIGDVLMESKRSFGHVEGHTYRLMSERPAVALAIFVAAGAIVAYMLGLFFLGGYISSANPYENGAVPYWDEDVCEICKQLQQQNASV